MKSDSNRGKSKTRGRFYERRDDCSQSNSSKDFECFYCHENGHIQRNCEELTKHLKEKRRQKAQEIDFANVIGGRYDREDNVYSVTTKGDNSDSWILDSACSFHIYPCKEWFDSYEPCDDGILLMADDSSVKAIGIGVVKLEMFDGVVGHWRMLGMFLD